MADKPVQGPTAGKVLLVFLAILTVMFFIWLYTGGPERYQELKDEKADSLQLNI
ncbi:MAG: hypothetical protein RL641_925 [Candidatus Parcubacteria bacterium]|jgi:hypothetical protein